MGQINDVIKVLEGSELAWCCPKMGQQKGPQSRPSVQIPDLRLMGAPQCQLPHTQVVSGDLESTEAGGLVRSPW